MAVVILHSMIIMQLVTTEFKSGGLHEKHVEATWKGGEPSQHSLLDAGKPAVTVHFVRSIMKVEIE